MSEERGCHPDERLKRLGLSAESATRLARKTSEAHAVLGVHGVSVTAEPKERPHSVAARTDVDALCRVHDTPTRRDPLDRTVELPMPVTQDVAATFNRLFGR